VIGQRGIIDKVDFAQEMIAPRYHCASYLEGGLVYAPISELSAARINFVLHKLMLSGFLVTNKAGR
jgi:hypothetical protein